MKKKKKSRALTVILIIIIAAGLSLLLYPTIADSINSRHQTKVISSYKEKVSELSEEDYSEEWQEATDYNASLKDRVNMYRLSEEEKIRYGNCLNILGNGIMGYIKIPVINVNLPIYHGTSDGVLDRGVGHLEWSSLPVGGEGSHCVLSGHRGLPSSKLFTQLDKVREGDTFELYVLDEKLTYEVDQIRVVEPKDVETLILEEGKDYCTLVTCTPYGINTHRLLVRGHRVENDDDTVTVNVTGDAVQIRPVLVAVIVEIPVILLTALFLLIFTKRRKKKETRNNK